METVAAVKYGDRKKGTPNRLTKEVRTLLKNLLYISVAFSTLFLPPSTKWGEQS